MRRTEKRLRLQITVVFLFSVTFTISKYVIEKQVGTLTLNVTSANVLLPGLQFKKEMGDSVTQAVFGRTEDYESEIEVIEPINVDVKRTGKIKLYDKGTTAYILSDRKIYANPNCFQMFLRCTELTAVDFSNFDTGIVTDMRGMFLGCGKLTTVNVDSWDTGKVEDMSHMLFDCGKLASVYVGSGWNTDNASSSGKMFTQCNNLTGGEGTSYDDAHTDKAYARIDGGAANPGYFTGAGQ